MKRIKLSYCKGYYAPIPEDHVFPMRKFEGLHAYLMKEFSDKIEIIEPDKADKTLLLLNHRPEYVDKILYGGLSYKEERRMGLPWSPGLADRSSFAVMGTLNAARIALKEGIAGNLAGGTHHAMPDFGEGFCVFNDVAIAIKKLKQEGAIKSSMVIDLDVHQGNGTAYSFLNDPSCFTVSVHGQKNYPFRKEQSDIDIGLVDHTDDQSYLNILDDLLNYLSKQPKPDLLFYLAGIDILATDHFGRIGISYEGLRKRDLLVLQHAYERRIPLCILLSGGYAPTVEQTVKAHASVFEQAIDIFT